MSKLPSREHLTAEQAEALEQGALLVIRAQREAKSMLARAGLHIPDDGFGFGSPCNAHIEGHGNCPCTIYKGDGEPCRTRITVDAGSSPPHRSCGHPPSAHTST